MIAMLDYECGKQTAKFTVTQNGDGTSTMNMEFDPAIDDATEDPTGLLGAVINAMELLTGQEITAE